MSSSSQNITFELLSRAAESPKKSALILTNEEITYEELDRLVWRVTSLLYERGVRAGDVVGILQEQEFIRVLSVLGLIRLGATVVPLARSLTTYQRDEISSLIGIKWVLTDFLTSQANELSIIKVDLQDILNHQYTRYELLCETPQNDCLLVLGSGSTGKQKVIPQSHATLRHRISIAFMGDGYLSDERVLSLTNLEFASGINRLLSVISIGGAFAVLNMPFKSLTKYCDDKKITTLFGAVFHMEKLLSLPRNNSGLLLPGLRALRVSGSSVSMNLRIRIRDSISPNLHLVYGANECGRISVSIAPKVYEDPFTVGYPLSGVEVEVVDSEGCLLPRGSRGQLKVRTPSVISGYINDLEASKKHFIDGWFYTGDIGEVTESGSLRIFGRADNMMIVNGINIYPIEIEQTLKEVLGVLDVVAMPIKHQIYQDIPIAVVSIDPKSNLDSSKLHEISVSRLGFRAPRKIVVVSEIPRNMNGKVQAKELAQLLKKHLDESS